MKEKRKFRCISNLLMLGSLLVISPIMQGMTHTLDYLNIYLGIGFKKVGHINDLGVNPGYVTRYVPNRSMKIGAFFGAGMMYNYFFHHEMNRLSAGISVYFLNFGHPNGDAHPFYNVFPSADPLVYHVSAYSYPLFLEFKIQGFHLYGHPYFLFGLGASWNHLSNYKEIPEDPCSSAASPLFYPFKQHTNFQFAYEAGIGIQWFLTRHISWGLDYRYLNVGIARLGTTSLARTASDYLSLGHLAAHVITASLHFSA